MDTTTKNMLASLFMANGQTKQGFEGIIPALKSLEGTEKEKKKLSTISHKYLEIVRLLSEIQTDLSSLK